jgi:hypothetical protein
MRDHRLLTLRRRRICSAGCVYSYFNEPFTPSTQAAVTVVGDSDDGLMVSLPPNDYHEQVLSEQPQPEPVPDVVTPRTDLPGPVDEYGIPLSVPHRRRPGGRDEVWDFMHDLTSEHVSTRISAKEGYRSICLICAKQLRASRRSPCAWENALFNNSNTTNAKTHFKLKHPEHPIGERELLKDARRVDAAVASFEATKATTGQKRRRNDSAVTDRSTKLTRSQSITEMLRPSMKTINSAISAWITEDGTMDVIYGSMMNRCITNVALPVQAFRSISSGQQRSSG